MGRSGPGLNKEESKEEMMCRNEVDYDEIGKYRSWMRLDIKNHIRK